MKFNLAGKKISCGENDAHIFLSRSDNERVILIVPKNAVNEEDAVLELSKSTPLLIRYLLTWRGSTHLKKEVNLKADKLSKYLPAL